MVRDSVQRIGGLPNEHCALLSGIRKLINLSKISEVGAEGPLQTSVEIYAGEDVYFFSFFVKMNTEKILIILSRETLVQPRQRIRDNGSILRPSLKDSRSTAAIPVKQYPLYMVCLELLLLAYQD